MKRSWPDDAATIAWEGDSREVLAGFPVRIKGKLGQELMRLQLGEKPLNSRPMQSIGSGVFELRQADSGGWYRVIYLQRIGDKIHVLHAFIKKSARTPANELKIAGERLKKVKARLAEEKKHGKDYN